MPALRHLSRSPESACAVIGNDGRTDMQFIPDQLGGSVAVQHRHLDIHEDEVRAEFFQHIDGLPAILRDAYYQTRYDAKWWT